MGPFNALQVSDFPTEARKVIKRNYIESSKHTILPLTAFRIFHNSNNIFHLSHPSLKMASNPPGECCTRGVLHNGTPTGSVEKIGSIDTYIARPATPSDKAILLFTDIFGLYNNVKLIADAFAKRGYLTIVPDLFNDDAVPPDALEGGKFDLPAWLAKHPTTAIDSIKDIVLKHIKTELKIKRLGSVGYCFGGKYVVRDLKDGVLDVGYIAHPSFVTVEELSAITGPLSIAAAETDTIFTPELRHESEKILAKLGVPYQLNLYGSVTHGFAVRADLSISKVRFAADQAFEQAVTWFDTWL